MTITSYLTPTEAQTILDEILGTELFAEFSTEEQQKALNTATVSFNNLAYSGDKTSDTQSNEFPRNGDTTPPDDFLLAVALESLILLDGKNSESEWESAFLLSQDFAGIASRYDRSVKEPNIMCGIMSIKSYQLIKKYLADYQAVNIVRD